VFFCPKLKCACLYTGFAHVQDDSITVNYPYDIRVLRQKFDNQAKYLREVAEIVEPIREGSINETEKVIKLSLDKFYKAGNVQCIFWVTHHD